MNSPSYISHVRKFVITLELKVSEMVVKLSDLILLP